MSGVSRQNGGVPLTTLSALAPWEATLILNLRLWCDGPMGQQEVWSEYRRTFARPEAARNLRQFEGLVRILTEHAKRPLVRHQVGCACVGADEYVFANLVRIASDNDLHDASLIATLIVGPDWAEDIAGMARDVGRACRALPSPARTEARAPSHVTLH